MSRTALIVAGIGAAAAAGLWWWARRKQASGSTATTATAAGSDYLGLGGYTPGFSLAGSAGLSLSDYTSPSSGLLSTSPTYDLGGSAYDLSNAGGASSAGGAGRFFTTPGTQSPGRLMRE